MNVRLVGAAVLAAVAGGRAGRAAGTGDGSMPVGGIVRTRLGRAGGRRLRERRGRQAGADWRRRALLASASARAACPARGRAVHASGPSDGHRRREARSPASRSCSDPFARFAEEVVVAAVRADAEAPITKRDLDRAEIEARNTGQEMPFLLKEVPSVTQYSDSGSSTGYSYMYLRGIPQTRMNVTLDGVPLNEPEDSAFYFANFGDFANAIESLQVQRGVGHVDGRRGLVRGLDQLRQHRLEGQGGGRCPAGGRLVRHQPGQRGGPLGQAWRRHQTLWPGRIPGHRRVPEQLGLDAAQCVSRRDARYGQVVLQGLRVRGAGSIAARVPGGRRGNARSRTCASIR